MGWNSERREINVVIHNVFSEVLKICTFFHLLSMIHAISGYCRRPNRFRGQLKLAITRKELKMSKFEGCIGTYCRFEVFYFKSDVKISCLLQYLMSEPGLIIDPDAAYCHRDVYRHCGAGCPGDPHCGRVYKHGDPCCHGDVYFYLCGLAAHQISPHRIRQNLQDPRDQLDSSKWRMQ